MQHFRCSENLILGFQMREPYPNTHRSPCPTDSTGCKACIAVRCFCRLDRMDELGCTFSSKVLKCAHSAAASAPALAAAALSVPARFNSGVKRGQGCGPVDHTACAAQPHHTRLVSMPPVFFQTLRGMTDDHTPNLSPPSQHACHPRVHRCVRPHSTSKAAHRRAHTHIFAAWPLLQTKKAKTSSFIPATRQRQQKHIGPRHYNVQKARADSVFPVHPTLTERKSPAGWRRFRCGPLASQLGHGMERAFFCCANDAGQSLD